MTRHRAALAVAAWCAVVVLVSSFVWVVISHAGQGVVPVSADVPEPSQGTGPPSPSHHASRPPASQASGTPTHSPSAGSTSGPSSSAPTQAPPSSPVPVTVRGVWNGAGGTLVAECRGTVISYVAATPTSGWRLEVAQRGPAVVRVAFARSGETNRDLGVTGSCVQGSPRFTSGIETTESGDDRTFSDG